MSGLVRRAGGLRLACRVPADLPEAVGLLLRLGFVDEPGARPPARGLAKTLARAS